jgi:hypothetical protein
MSESTEATEISRVVSLLTRVTSLKVAQNGGVLAILSLLAYYALFRLPFRFPPGERLMSASYAFGFNNAVAIIALAGLLVLVTLVYLLRGTFTANAAITVSDRNGNGWTPTKIAFAIACTAYAGLTF